MPVFLPGSVSGEWPSVRLQPSSKPQRIGGMMARYCAEWEWEEEGEEEADLVARLDQLPPTQENDENTAEPEEEGVAA